MNTTTVFAEILIIGIQGGIWLALLLLTIFGTHHVAAVGVGLREWTTLATILLIALLYSLGIILDRVYNVIEHAVHPTKPLFSISWVDRKARAILSDDAVRVHALDGTLSNYQQYVLSRFRVARATFFNLILVTAGALLFILVRFDWLESSLKWRIVLSVLGFGALLTAMCFIAYATLQRTYEVRGEQVRVMLLDGIREGSTQLNETFEPTNN
jgi:hypothetical protein